MLCLVLLLGIACHGTQHPMHMQSTPRSVLKTFGAQALNFAAVAQEHVEKLGARIRERREELGLSQDELGRRIGLKATGNYVSRWERAANQPDDDYLPLIAKALETT